MPFGWETACCTAMAGILYLQGLSVGELTLHLPSCRVLSSHSEAQSAPDVPAQFELLLSPNSAKVANSLVLQAAF